MSESTPRFKHIESDPSAPLCMPALAGLVATSRTRVYPIEVDMRLPVLLGSGHQVGDRVPPMSATWPLTALW